MIFRVLKIPKDEATSLQAIRERGDRYEARSHDDAAAKWCRDGVPLVDPARGEFELAVADERGAHKMYTVTPVTELRCAPSKCQELDA